MSDLKDLNRAVQSAVFPGHHWAQAVREWIGAATERMEGGGGISVECVEADSGYLCTKLAGHEGEHLALGLANGERHHWPKKPASEGGKAECNPWDHVWSWGECQTCKPAPPEPVAAAMPEAVAEAVLKLHAASLTLKNGWESDLCEEASVNLKSFWRTHAAQPAKVRMSNALERVLDCAEMDANRDRMGGHESTAETTMAAIRMVRSQAAEAVDASAIYDKGFADGIALQKKCAAEAGKVPDCVIHAVRLRRSYLCDLPNSDYGKEQALEMRTIEDWLRAAEGRK